MAEKSSITFPGAIAPTVDVELSQLGIHYDVIAHPETSSLNTAASLLGMPRDRIARAVVMRDGDYLCMIVLPASHIVDFSELKVLTQRDLEPVSVHAVSGMFPDCELDSIPPFGGLYNIETFYDTSLLAMPSVIFRAGTHHTLIRLSRTEFEKLVASNLCGSFARPVEVLRLDAPAAENAAGALDLAVRFRHFTPVVDAGIALEDTEKLASRPALAAALIALLNAGDPGDVHSQHELEAVLEQEPVLAAQFLSLVACSVFSETGVDDSRAGRQPDGFAKRLESLKTLSLSELCAQEKLSIELITGILLSLAVLNHYRFQASGVLGPVALWRQAWSSAGLLLRINAGLAPEQQMPESLLCLSGCLHNLGFFLYGCMLQSKYHLFNKLVESNPGVGIRRLETLFSRPGRASAGRNLDHTGIAARLINQWGLPQAVVTAIKEHHDPDYRGEYSNYPNLVLLTDRLLHETGLGDAESSELPAALLEKFALSQSELLRLGRQFVSATKDLEQWLPSILH